MTAALRDDTGAATDWYSHANASVYCLYCSGSTVYAGGDFTSIRGYARGHIAALVPHNGEDLYATELERPLALAIGNEGSGLSDALIERADIRVTIPMATGTESLNAAAAAAVALFECVRRRL